MKLVQFLTLAAIAAIGIRSQASAQWIETEYTESYAAFTVDLNHWTSNESKNYTWPVSVFDHWKVSGSATQSPPWRMTFAALVDNTGSYSEIFTDYVENGKTVTNKRRYTTGTGTNKFAQDMEQLAPEPSPTTNFVERNLDSLVTNDLWYTIS